MTVFWMDLNKILAIILETFLEFIHGVLTLRHWKMDAYNIQTSLNLIGQMSTLNTNLIKVNYLIHIWKFCTSVYMFQIIHYFFTVHIIAVTNEVLFRHIYYTNRKRFIIGREPHFGADVSNMFLGRLGQKKIFCVRARNVFLASYLSTLCLRIVCTNSTHEKYIS